MKNRAADTAITGVKSEGSNRQADLSTFPVLKDLIQDLMPELLDGSACSITIQKQILEYLFEEPDEESPLLQKRLSEELYTSLLGLKILLRPAPNYHALELAMELHKRRFEQFLFGGE